ncbi:MAG TPA: TrmH family RNA methyltransferase [Candidatus Saccharimonadales bacterium]|nr:TrmH family RNA methyltransferase [Candidatus Saccharimonadales bacterium]
MPAKIVLIAHNLRSAHNVGSILRSADAFAIDQVYLSGYSPYPKQADDPRLPHLADKATKQIAKTALGAEKTVPLVHHGDIFKLLEQLRAEGFQITALEQSRKSIPLNDFQPGPKLAIIVGREVEGIEPEVLRTVDKIIEIPMLGTKESLNVASAAAIAMYDLRTRT